MVSFKISYGKESNLPQIIKNGNMYFCTDTGNLFIDHLSERIHVNARKAQMLTYFDEKTNKYIDIDAKTLLELSNGGSADWSQNDPTAPDYVKNRTHWEEGSQTVIEWDGNTEGRDSVGTVYKISDLTPSIDELIGAIFVMSDGETLTITDSDVLEPVPGFVSITTVGVAVFYSEKITDSSGTTLTVPSTGVYAEIEGTYVSSITYGSTTVHQLDEKFIPESIARKTDVTWESLPDKPFGEEISVTETEILPEYKVYFSNMASSGGPVNAGIRSGIPFTGTVADGDRCIITVSCDYESGAIYNGTYECTAYTANNQVLVGDKYYWMDCSGEHTAEVPFCLCPAAKTGVGIMGSSFTIRIVKVEEGVTINKLDEKFIPESIARKTDVTWEAIPDKPFGESQTVIEWDGNTEGRDSFTANWFNDNDTYYKVSDDVPAADDLVGGSVSGVFDGTTVQLPIESVDMLMQGNGAYSLEGLVVFVQNTTFDFADASITAPSCGVYIVDRSVAEITSLTYGSTTIHQLDEKYIPESIARKSDIVPGVSSWNDLLDKPSALPNPQSLTFRGAVNASYDGSKEVVVEIPVVEVPVTSVNGMTGDVTINIPNIPVTSVNGMTGDVVIEAGSGSGSSVQPDWSQNDETAADYVKNRTHWKEKASVEELFSETDIDFSERYISRPSTFQIEDGEYTVVIDGVSYVYTPATYQGMTYIGDISNDPILVLIRDGNLEMFISAGGTHSVEISRVKVAYHKLDNKYIDAMREFIIPVDFNNARLTSSSTSGVNAGTARYKVAIETAYSDISRAHSEGQHLIVRLDNLNGMSYYFNLVNSDNSYFRFESTTYVGNALSRICSMHIELSRTSYASNDTQVLFQVTYLETNMPPKAAVAIADLTAAPTMEDFNNLLTVLRNAGYLATE